MVNGLRVWPTCSNSRTKSRISLIEASFWNQYCLQLWIVSWAQYVREPPCKDETIGPSPLSTSEPLIEFPTPQMLYSYLGIHANIL